MKLMTQKDWINIKHFNENEDWGNWTKLYYDLIFAVDKLRDYCGHPIIINCGYAKFGHSPNSYHYKGMAIDIHIKNMDVIDQFVWASRIDEFNGIGVYPKWAHPGLHLDIRPHKNKFDQDSRWLAYYKNGTQSYTTLSWENIKKYC